MKPLETQLIDAAKSVLQKNQGKHFTKIAPGYEVYPWSWDTGFVALAYARFDLNRAVQELRQLFDKQADNGMLSQVEDCGKAAGILDPTQLQLVEQAAAKLQTSGIATPPVYAFVLWRIYEITRNKARAKAILKEFYPKVLALHRYLYRYRDPLQEGLISLHHPWESGKGQFFHPFLIQDPFFNGLLSYSNECLIKIGSLLGENIHEIMDWHELTIFSMNEKLWDKERGIYNAYDMQGECSIQVHSISGFIPMIGEVPTQDQAEAMLLFLESEHFGGKQDDLYCFPGYSLLQDDVDFENPWKGPICLKMNWMLYQGLCRYDMHEMADLVRRDSMELLSQYGFYECFDPRKKTLGHLGLGASNYSCSAAIGIEFLLGE
ncbi:MAG: hypothetical protein DHS20C18_37650 [Saprospiraceae bacterium]|nr:MAG: hypothetical protein DHS20C18_37650 [Saprospiraceae bacterium]